MLRPMPIGPIPPETARIAHAAFPKGNRYLRVADELETLLTDEAFLTLFPMHGQPALPPWRLALVTLPPCAEGLSDRQAAHAVRSRIDWQDVRRLDLMDPGFDASVLSAVRTRLITGAAASLLGETVRTWGRDRQLITARGRQRTDATPMLAAVRALNRIAVVGETLRHALHTLAVAAPEWLRAASPPDGRARYARRAEDDRVPSTQAARAALARASGHNGWQWLSAVDPPEAPAWLWELPAVVILRRVWGQNEWRDGRPRRWREADNIPPAARFISSPDDPEAHDARKDSTQWVGDTVHLTEPCEEDGPHLITHVETTMGPAAGGAATPQIHAALQHRGLLPGTHIVDPGSLDAALLVESRDDYGVDLLGPPRLDDHGQAQAGFDAQHFQSAWARQHATCPAGKTSTGWTPAVDNRGHAVIKVQCSSRDGRRCEPVAQCIRAKKRYPRRPRTLRPERPYQARQAARQREATDAFQAEYARRAGEHSPHTGCTTAGGGASSLARCDFASGITFGE